jgi:hypothetical protein
MTTIAYRDGILAADTMMCRGGEYTYGAEKLFRTNSFMVGVSGDMSNVRAFEDWLTDAEDGLLSQENASSLHRWWSNAPDFGEGFCAILIDVKTGFIWSCVNAPPVRVIAPYEAIGSGAKYAMGAMAMGATAQKAVTVAAAARKSTHGSVRVALRGALRNPRQTLRRDLHAGNEDLQDQGQVDGRDER